MYYLNIYVYNTSTIWNQVSPEFSSLPNYLSQVPRKYHVIGCKTIKWKNNNLLSPYADTQPLHT